MRRVRGFKLPRGAAQVPGRAECSHCNKAWNAMTIRLKGEPVLRSVECKYCGQRAKFLPGAEMHHGRS